MLLVLGLRAQHFVYQYIDPCTKDIKSINADMSAPIIIAYYGQVKAFTFDELQNGSFDLWMNEIYLKYRNASPCQGAVVTTTATSNSNQVYNVMSSVMSITSIDFSSLTNSSMNVSGVGSSVGQGTSRGSSGSNASQKKEKEKTGQETDVGGSDNGSDSRGNTESGKEGNGSGESNGESETSAEEIPDDGPQSSEAGQNIGSSASKAKAEVQKPAILLTGDVVGVQTVKDGAQDARGTASFTRVKGDGTASIGLSADYMVNARIGNFSAVKSWISVNERGHKSINLVNAGLNYLPRSWSATGMFIRVNSLKKFTAIYGVAGSYGSLFGEEIISTMAIAGFMYKGKITKNLDATVIAAGIYSPYTKYYTESLFESSPVIIPFLNLTYKMTKTFGVGLTGGGTYIAGQDVINYQLLMGAKLIL